MSPKKFESFHPVSVRLPDFRLPPSEVLSALEADLNAWYTFKKKGRGARIFVFPRGKGSSTSSATLMESIKNGVAPAAIINLKVDPIMALGSIVSDELYHKAVPIVILAEKDFYSIKEDDHITIEADGTVKISTES